MTTAEVFHWIGGINVYNLIGCMVGWFIGYKLCALFKLV